MKNQVDHAHLSVDSELQQEWDPFHNPNGTAVEMDLREVTIFADECYELGLDPIKLGEALRGSPNS